MPSLLSSFASAFYKGIWRTVADRVYEILVAVAGTAYFLIRVASRSGFSWQSLTDNAWEALAVGSWVICALIMWHAVRAFAVVSNEVKEASRRPPPPPKYLPILSPSGERIPVVSDAQVTESHSIPKLLFMTACVVALAFAASYFIWEKTENHEHSLGEAEEKRLSIRVTGFILPQQTLGHPLVIEISVVNDALSPVTISGASAIGLYNAVENSGQREQLEEKVFSAAQEEFTKRQKENSLVTQEIPQQAGMHVALDTTSKTLTQEMLSSITDGRITAYFAGILHYRDRNGEHFIPYCGYTDASIHSLPNCTHHNTPY